MREFANLRSRRRALTRFLLVSFATSVLIACGQARSGSESASPSPDDLVTKLSVDEYNRILVDLVDDDGLVDYATLKDQRGPLDAFIRDLGRLDPAAFRAWPREARLAFWINAYNAITLQRIVDHYPIDRGGLLKAVLYPANSIRQIDGVWTELSSPVMGQSMTLDHIEHEILRKEFGDPRIHAAIVCASIGCPPLRAEAFRAIDIDAQLDEQCRRFLGAPQRFRVDRERNIVLLSPILKWFAEDFVAAYGDLGPVGAHDEKVSAALHFAGKFVSEADADFIATGKYRVQYLDYDWSLNEQP